MIYFELFLSFLQIGLFSVGGGYAAIPLIQEQIVETHHWLSAGEFTNLITIAEMTPGPMAINSATFTGIRIAGLPGAAVATFGCICPSLFLVSLLAFVYYRYQKLALIKSVLASLRPAVVALIASTGITILMQVVFNGTPDANTLNWFGLILFLLAFFLLRKRKKNPIIVMLLCGCLSLAAGLLF